MISVTKLKKYFFQRPGESSLFGVSVLQDEDDTKEPAENAPATAVDPLAMFGL